MNIRSLRIGLAAGALATLAVGGLAVPAHAAPGVCAPQPKPTITVKDAAAYENSAAKVKISLSNSMCTNVHVDYQTSNWTATGADYVAHPLTTLVFTPGQTVKFITIVTKADALAEGNETLRVNLSNAVNGSIADSIGVVTIYNGSEPAG
jgi:hypothetical protein